MLDEAKAQQTKIAADLKAQSERELSAMRDQARRDIETASKAALAEVYDQAAVLATSVAGKILQREISAADQQRLVDESLAELSSN